MLKLQLGFHNASLVRLNCKSCALEVKGAASQWKAALTAQTCPKSSQTNTVVNHGNNYWIRKQTSQVQGVVESRVKDSGFPSSNSGRFHIVEWFSEMKLLNNWSPCRIWKCLDANCIWVQAGGSKWYFIWSPIIIITENLFSVSRLNIWELWTSAFLLFCSIYDFHYKGKNRFYIYMICQSVAFFIMGLGYCGTFVPS